MMAKRCTNLTLRWAKSAHIAFFITPSQRFSLQQSKEKISEKQQSINPAMVLPSSQNLFIFSGIAHPEEHSPPPHY